MLISLFRTILIYIKFSMINLIIWFLTDTDFSEEWSNATVLGKVELLYTTIGFLFCWIMTLLSIFEVIF
jgi:hypothetical protein